MYLWRFGKNSNAWGTSGKNHLYYTHQNQWKQSEICSTRTIKMIQEWLHIWLQKWNNLGHLNMTIYCLGSSDAIRKQIHSSTRTGIYIRESVLACLPSVKNNTFTAYSSTDSSTDGPEPGPSITSSFTGTLTESNLVTLLQEMRYVTATTTQSGKKVNCTTREECKTFKFLKLRKFHR